MDILHYSLGLPPYARGGLTKYVVDLMYEQKRQGHDTYMLWPGKIGEEGFPVIRRKKIREGIDNFEIVNPEYLPQIYGIKEMDKFQVDAFSETYREFLTKYKPDVIHVHTLMGLHKCFLEVAKELGIKTVYTTHDCFGICPKTTLFFNGKTCIDNVECVGCKECCENALSIRTMKLAQSSTYRLIKNSSLMKVIRKRKKNNAFELDNKTKKVNENDTRSQRKYQKLREGYLEYFKLFDIIHFNSSYMKDIFEKYMDVENGKVINITHADISDNKDNYHKKTEDIISFSFLGALVDYKGFFVMCEALDRLYSEGITNFELNLYDDNANMTYLKDYMNVHYTYDYSELKNVMNKMDVLIHPHDGSFGFTVQEALSFGIPVIASKQMGAKDLIKDGVTGYIVNYDCDSFYNVLKELLLNPKHIDLLKKNVKEQFKVITIKEHAKDVEKELY